VDRRSIPACAGEPRNLHDPNITHRVYPRVRGGTIVSVQWNICELGLSPRARGNHRFKRLRGLAEGSIPACAGEPPTGIARVGPAAVYPRVRGGTDADPMGPDRHDGLSPRARGNLKAFSSAGSTLGSIPACAGEP